MESRCFIGKYFYINDNGDVWTPGWKPVKAELDKYECRHGLGYTKITGQRNNLEAEILHFVPLGFNGEVERVRAECQARYQLRHDLDDSRRELCKMASRLREVEQQWQRN